MTKTIVITGSTKGIGYGLAEEFLKRGHNVVVSGRNQERLDQAVGALSAKHRNVAGCLCNVTQFADHEQLFAFAKEKFGRVDIWINNAGISLPRHRIWEQPKENHDLLIASNLMSAIYGSHVAVRGMIAQGGGYIFNMEGHGSNGRIVSGMTVYGASKSGLTYFTKSLAEETKNTPVKVCLLSPGIVDTDLLMVDYQDEPQRFEAVKRRLNILADKVETVTPFLVKEILKEPKNGAQVAWLTPGKVIFRFATARFIKRKIFD
jgi:NAD(P)-dependent dehydrogenase (short-subunit alcohol dehydrogenase family)